MASLEFMPTEILLIIISFLPEDYLYKDHKPTSHTPYRDLASLALTSRQLHGLFNPILYCSSRDCDESAVVMKAIDLGAVDTLKKAVSFGIPLEPPGVALWHADIMFLAITYGHEEIVAFLLDHGVKADGHSETTRLNTSDSRLCLALEMKQASIARLLIKNGAHLEFYQGAQSILRIREAQVSAIHIAAGYGLTDVVEFLMQQTGIDINTPDSRGNTCLHYAARNNETNAIRDLVKLGADINWASNDGTPLFIALQEVNYQTAQAIIDAGSNINERSPSGWLPIHFCVLDYYGQFKEQHIRLLWSLIRRGADVNATTQDSAALTPLDIATLEGSTVIMRILMEAGARSGERSWEDLEWSFVSRRPQGRVWQQMLNF